MPTSAHCSGSAWECVCFWELWCEGWWEWFSVLQECDDGCECVLIHILWVMLLECMLSGTLLLSVYARIPAECTSYNPANVSMYWQSLSNQWRRLDDCVKILLFFAFLPHKKLMTKQIQFLHIYKYILLKQWIEPKLFT